MNCKLVNGKLCSFHHPSAQSAHSTTQTRNQRNQQNSLSKRKITDHHYRHPFSFQSTDHYTISLPDSAISVICCLYWDIALTRFFNQICSAIETTNTSIVFLLLRLCPCSPKRTISSFYHPNAQSFAQSAHSTIQAHNQLILPPKRAIIRAISSFHHPSAQSAHSTTQTRNHSRNQLIPPSKRTISSFYHPNAQSFAQSAEFSIQAQNHRPSLSASFLFPIDRPLHDFIT